MISKQQRWRLNNKEKQWEAELRCKYGLTAEGYYALLWFQNETCAICRQPESAVDTRWTNKPKRLAVDHCHVTGRVRGLLCSACNLGLGGLKTPTRLRRAAIYLETR